MFQKSWCKTKSDLLIDEKSQDSENCTSQFNGLIGFFQHTAIILTMSTIGSLSDILKNGPNLPKDTKNVSSASNFIVLAIFSASHVSSVVVGSNLNCF